MREYRKDLVSGPLETGPFAAVPELVADLRQGRMVVILDDEDRENEGDLVMVAESVRPEDINFMARYGRGLICLTLTSERCEVLRLPLMVAGTPGRRTTNFTVSIEAAQGVTTGISAADRTTTIRAAVAADAKPDHLVSPGHVFPLMAQPGGVLTRAGHTEAGCDLARLAGGEPAAVIVEILNEDGTMARRAELERFAAKHRLKMGTIADLIQYRLRHEQTTTLMGERPLTTEYGEFRLLVFQDSLRKELHFALVKGAVREDRPTLVRVHMLDMVNDLFGAARDDVTWSLKAVMQRLAREEQGVVIVLRQPQETPWVMAQLREEPRRERGGVGFAPPSEEEELRTYGLGAQILKHIGVGKMRVLGTPKRLHGLSGFGLEVVEYLPAESA